MVNSSPHASRTLLLGLLLMSAATLLLEVTLQRILSVTLWYHFAFMVLSTALFGFGFAGVLLFVISKDGRGSVRLLRLAACCTPIAFFVGYVIANIVPYEPFSLGRDDLQWLYLPLYYLAVTVPFFFSGLTIAQVITRYAEEVHRVYLFDLIGAGIGAPAVVLLLPRLGGSGTVFAAAGIAALGAALITYRESRILSLMSVVIAFACLGLSPLGDRIFPVRISANKVTGDGVPLGTVFRDPEFHRLTAWNTASRVDVVEWRDRLGMRQRTIFIDGGTALTRLVHPDKAVAVIDPGDDEESFFLRRFEKPKVLVIGSGGGREVLLALRAGAKKVTAVELNPAINDIVREKMADFTGDIYRDPRVRVVTDEARSFIERTVEQFDVIHCPHTISNAAMAAGSLSLAENYLLTVEAFEAYLHHLSRDGVLLITRPEAHIPRLFTTARHALKRTSSSSDKAPFSQQVMAFRRPDRGLSFYAGFALKKRPFVETEVAAFADTLARRSLSPLYLPHRAAGEPYRSIESGAALDEIPTPFPVILTPATDDRPFFNRRVSFSDIGWKDIANVFSRGKKGRNAMEDRPVTEAALLVLLVETVIVAGLFIFLPLFISRRRALAGKGQVETIVAFFALGMAYITVEMGLIHTFTLYLGRPTVVFATVLGALLVSSGVGSAVSRRALFQRAPWQSALAAGIIGLLTALLLPGLLNATIAYTHPLRIGVAALILFVPGFFMGMPFPNLIRVLKRHRHERIPVAFGINGFASVAGTITSVLVAMTLGQTAVLLIGVGCYVIAAGASFRLSR